MKSAQGVKVCKKLSLPALLTMLSEASAALEEAGGALMEIDDSTPDDVRALMARHKYLQDCIVLKAKAMSDTLPNDSVARTAIDQLCTAEEQYVEATRQLDELPEEAT